MRTFCINLSDTSAFLVPPLCLLWPTNCVHWAITVVTTVPPFSDHGNTWATLAMVLPSLCLLCATCCATTAALVVQGRHKGRAAAVTQKQKCSGFRRPLSVLIIFYGSTKVARRSQPCVKGALMAVPNVVILIISCEANDNKLGQYDRWWHCHFTRLISPPNMPRDQWFIHRSNQYHRKDIHLQAITTVKPLI